MWPKGKRRNDTDASRFIRALASEFSYAEIARLVGVSSRTVRRWANGEDWVTREQCMALVERLLSRGGPLYDKQHALPIYSADMAIDGNTRVGGVGQYTIRSARDWQRELHREIQRAEFREEVEKALSGR